MQQKRLVFFWMFPWQKKEECKAPSFICWCVKRVTLVAKKMKMKLHACFLVIIHLKKLYLKKTLKNLILNVIFHPSKMVDKN